MRVFANAPNGAVVLPPPAKTETHEDAFWFLLFDLITMCLVFLALCKLAFLTWPPHPMIALVLGMGIWVVTRIKAKNFLEWKRRNIPKFVHFVYSWAGFSLLMMIFETQFRAPMDELGVGWLVGWIAGGLLFASLMLLLDRMYDSSSS